MHYVSNIVSKSTTEDMAIVRKFKVRFGKFNVDTLYLESSSQKNSVVLVR
jgi:hypothetical protein